MVLKVSIQFVFTSQFFLIAFTIKVRDTQARLQIMCAIKRGTVSRHGVQCIEHNDITIYKRCKEVIYDDTNFLKNPEIDCKRSHLMVVSYKFYVSFLVVQGRKKIE